MSHNHKPTHRADAGADLDDRGHGYSGTTIRGGNPAHLIEKAVRDRITDSYYWKEQCFGLNAATLCDRAAELRYVGGTYGGMGKPTPFLCLLFKMLQLVPEKEVVLEYLNFCEDGDGEGGSDDEDNGGGILLSGNDMDMTSGPVPLHLRNKHGSFKYLRALAAFYIRLTWEPVEIYTTLEPLLSDYRKLKRRTRDGFTLTHMDQLVDDLLTKERIFATALWKLQPREVLEDLDLLEPRVSPLGAEVEALDEEVEELEGREREREGGELSDGGRGRGRDDYSERSSRSRSRSRSPRSRSRSYSSDERYRRRDSRSRSRSRSRSYSDEERYRRRDRRDSRSVDSYDSRRRSRSRERDE